MMTIFFKKKVILLNKIIKLLNFKSEKNIYSKPQIARQETGPLFSGQFIWLGTQSNELRDTTQNLNSSQDSVS